MKIASLSKKTVVLAGMAALASTVLVAPAAAADDDGVIYACASPISVRIVTVTQRCFRGEVRLTWNVQGPRGPKGDPGPPGTVDPAALANFEQQIAALQSSQTMQDASIGALQATVGGLITDRYVDVGDGTVLDRHLGLVWLKDSACAGLGDVSPGWGHWQAASDAVAGLGNGQCGLNDNSAPGDWRLPTKLEWMATIAEAQALGCHTPRLTDKSGAGCFADGPSAFALPFSWSTTGCWTATSEPGNANNAFYVSFSGPLTVFPVPKGEGWATACVWPVRKAP